MSIVKFWKTLFCYAWMPLYFGGDSSSQANQTQTSDTQDNRISAAADSANLNNSRGTIGGNVTNNVTTISTDNGAVNKSLDFASGTVSKSFDFAQAIAKGAADAQAASAGQIQATALSAMQAVQKSYQNESSTLANAYQNESSTMADAYKTSKAGEQKVMVAGALLIGGIVALKALGKA